MADTTRPAWEPASKAFDTSFFGVGRDQLIAFLVPAFFDLDPVRDCRFESQHALVKLAGFVQVKCRETNKCKSSMTHGSYSSRLIF
jgi:hypothetical protein